MGFSHAMAAAVIFAGVAVAGFHVTSRVFEAERTIDTARLGAQQRALQAARVSVSVADVDEAAGTVTVLANNTGAAVIDAGTLSLLLDGQPAAITGHHVAGKVTNVWAPGQQIEITATAGAPSSVVLASDAGVLAMWRL